MTRQLHANQWRMLRRLLKVHPRGLNFLQIRNWAPRRIDERNLQDLVALGLIVRQKAAAGEACYHITTAGIAAADMGEIAEGGAV